VVNGSIGTPLEQDLFTFDGEQGTVVTLTLVQTGALDAGFTLLGARYLPNGTVAPFFAQGITNWTLPATGTFVLRLFDSANTRRGTYSLRLGVVGTCPTPPPPPPPPGQAPDPPTTLTASVSGTTVTLNWMAATAGGPASSFVIEVGSAPGASNLLVLDTNSTATSFVATGAPGTYFVRVKARNSAGTSVASNEVIVLVGTGPGPCVAPPGAPTGLSVAVAGQQVTLRWTAPAGPVTAYIVEAGSASGASDIANFDTGSAATSLAAVAAPGTYFLRIRARNACGTSVTSNEAIVTVF
jgi:hypothetical protein